MLDIFHIGNTTYGIRFRNGTCEVVECEGDSRKVVFTGWYEKCRAWVKEADISYRESLL